MASTINASLSSGIVQTADTSGVLQLQTASTTAVTIDASQNVGVGSTPVNSRRLTVNTSGQTDLSIVAGSANYGQLLFGYTGADNKGILAYNNSDNSMQFYANSAERMRIDSSGNLGLGVTPSASTVTTLEMTNGFALTKGDVTYGGYLAGNAYYNAGWKYKTSNPAVAYALSGGGGQHQWFTAASGTAGNAITFTQAMTLDNSGNLMLGQTTPSNTVYGSFQNQTGQLSLITKTGNSQCLFLNRQDDTGTAILFRQANGTTGSITVTTNTTAYNTSSDYRLKNTIATMTGGLAKVSQLKPVTYKWNNDNSDGEGFIAHELAEVCPHAVYGTKDEVDSEGNPVYQGIDTSFLVATLTAAIQELSAQVTELKAEVQALKGA